MATNHGVQKQLGSHRHAGCYNIRLNWNLKENYIVFSGMHSCVVKFDLDIGLTHATHNWGVTIVKTSCFCPSARHWAIETCQTFAAFWLSVCVSSSSKTPHQPRGHWVALEDGPCWEDPAGRAGEAPEHDSTVQRSACFSCALVLPASLHTFTSNLFNRRVVSPARHSHCACSSTPNCRARGLFSGLVVKHSLAQAVCLLYRTQAVLPH